MEAYRSYVERNKEALMLVLAGGKGWLYEGIFQKVKEYGLEDKVIFTGYVEADEAPCLMQGARAFVFPSLYEGFGMPPIEAMACGAPVLSANTSSLPEVVGDAAVLVDPLSVDDICRGIEKLASDDVLCEKLSRAGIQRARQFTWKHSADIIRDLLRQMTFNERN